MTFKLIPNGRNLTLRMLNMKIHLILIFEFGWWEISLLKQITWKYIRINGWRNVDFQLFCFCFVLESVTELSSHKKMEGNKIFTFNPAILLLPQYCNSTDLASNAVTFHISIEKMNRKSSHFQEY